MANKNLQIALLGFGVVGSGTAQVITENQDRIRQATGRGIDIRYILDLREFPDSPFADRIVHDFSVIVDDPEVDVVVEMMGGSHPAYEFSRAALMAGKHVVTSNKEVVANFGTELLSLAAKNGVRYLFEASVGGGIPVLRPLSRDLAANRVLAIDGILNGTTNYILTRMMEGGVSFDTALCEAQSLGYAEKDPTADVDGPDAARKIVILAALSTGLRIDPNTISMQGIRSITTAHVAAAAAFGCAVKLIGHMSYDADTDRIDIWVAPCFVPEGHPLYAISDVFNGVLIETDMLGRTLFYGRGAGKLPTAGAVVSDLTDIALSPTAPARRWQDAPAERIAPAAEQRTPVCLILEGAKLPSVPAGVSAVSLPENNCCAVLLPAMTEAEADAFAAACGRALVARYRCLSL